MPIDQKRIDDDDDNDDGSDDDVADDDDNDDGMMYHVNSRISHLFLSQTTRTYSRVDADDE